MIAALKGALLLGACADMPEMPDVTTSVDVREGVERRFVEAQTEAITRIPVAQDAFRPVAIESEIRPVLAQREINVRFAENATIGDLISALGAVGMDDPGQKKIPIVLERQTGMEEALDAKLPFSSYRGNLGDMLEILRRASAIISSQRGEFIYLGTLARYSVDLPQNDDIMTTIQSEIESLGATNVVKSVTGGQMIYEAQPDTHESLIDPFLSRVSDNLAMVSMQVAIVSLALNDSTSQGFDWNAFRLGIDTTNQRLGQNTNTGSSNNTSPDNGNGTTDTTGSRLPSLGTVLDATASAVSLSRGDAGTLFGQAATFTIGSALNFLSTFGNTEIVQNVELQTIAGKEVTLRSGQEVPFVSGISQTTTGETTSSGVETKTIQTGLTLTLSPFFDSATKLITLNLDLEQRQILQFVELSAGNEAGTITQPLTQDQNLTDIIRVPVGQTIVVGGLQNSNDSTTGSEPAFLRGLSEDQTFGNRSRNVSRNSFFIVVRPTVTVFERRKP